MDLHTKYQGCRSNGSGVSALTDGRTDGRTLPSALSPCFAKGLVTLIKILLKIVLSKIFMESSRNLQPTHTVKDPGVLYDHFQSLLNLL